MALKVTVQPRLLRWARQRAALGPAELAAKLGLKTKRVEEWEGTGEISLAHLERIAEKTRTPIGYLFLTEPPSESLPIADFRTHGGARPNQPSPDLLATVYQCQQRQLWYREYLQGQNEESLQFVGSAAPDQTPSQVAQRIRNALGLSTAQRAEFATWSDALRDLFSKVEAIGVLVMRNGVVGNNTRRKLNVAEFRGFTLSDTYAPVIFVNGADSMSAQMFTLAHELGHLWRGESGISDADPRSTIASERFSNRVAAELLVPMVEFREAWNSKVSPGFEAERLARYFKVSTLAMLIRASEADVLDPVLFERLYATEVGRAAQTRMGGGGNFYRTQRTRLSGRFATAVIVSALEGGTTYKEAYQLLGIRKSATFDEFARFLGVRP